MATGIAASRQPTPPRALPRPRHISQIYATPLYAAITPLRHFAATQMRPLDITARLNKIITVTIYICTRSRHYIVSILKTRQPDSFNEPRIPATPDTDLLDRIFTPLITTTLAITPLVTVSRRHAKHFQLRQATPSRQPPPAEINNIDATPHAITEPDTPPLRFRQYQYASFHAITPPAITIRH
jgi:hypothetical protein